MTTITQASVVSLRGTNLASDELVGWSVTQSRSKNYYTSNATVEISTAAYDSLVPELNDQMIIKRGPTTGSEYTIFRGKIHVIKNDESRGIVSISLRDPLYDLQNDLLTTSFDASIDTEAGVVSAIAQTVIEGGGLTANVTSSSDYPVRNRYVINKEPRYEVLKDLASFLNWTLYFDHENDQVNFEPLGLNEYGTDLIVGTNVINLPVWETDKTKMRNYIYVDGAFETDWKTETFSVAGSETEFTLTDEPLTTEVLIDGTKQVRGIPGSTDPYDYYVKQESKQIIFPSDPSGTTMTVNYEAKIPITIEGGNWESIDRYGRQDDNFNFKDIVDVDDAEYRHNYLLEALGWPIISGKMHVINIHDLNVKHVAHAIDNNKGVDAWLPVESIMYTYPEPFDIVSLGDRPYDFNDVLNNLNKRLRTQENLETQNQQLLRQKLQGSSVVSTHQFFQLDKVSTDGNYYDQGVVYDDSQVYDNQTETTTTNHLTQNTEAFFEDLLSDEFKDSTTTNATVNQANGTISFSDAQIYQSLATMKGGTYTNCRLRYPSDSITGTLTHEVMRDGTTWHSVSLGTIYNFTTDASTVPEPVSAWPFQGDATDSIQSNDATVTGASLTTDKDGNSNSAYSFNGSSDKMLINDHPTLNVGTGDFTIAMWIYPETIDGNYHRLFDKRGTKGYTFSIKSGGTLIGEMNDGSAVEGINANTVLSENTWYHVAITFDRDGDATIYLNGTADGSRDISALNASLDETTKVHIGVDAPTGASSYYHGKMDAVCFWKRALTATEISALYSSGTLREFVYPKGIRFRTTATGTASVDLRTDINLNPNQIQLEVNV